MTVHCYGKEQRTQKKFPSQTWMRLRGRLVLPLLLSSRSLVASMMTKAFDPIYPGTAVARMNAARERARSLTDTQLNGDWVAVRRALLWAAGLRDDTTSAPGQGYTGHAFKCVNALHQACTVRH